MGGIAHDGASSVGGHGGINGGCTGWGVWPNMQKYSSSHRVRSSTVDAIGCTPTIRQGFGEWMKAAVVAEGWTVGYGALNDVGAWPRDGVCNVADLGCIKQDSGTMN